MHIDKTIQPIIQTIIKAGGHPYIVGGAVRDFVLEQPYSDIDIEIFDLYPDQIKTCLKQHTTLPLDERYADLGIFKIKGLDVDFSMPRKISGKKDALISPLLPPEEAILRRDFTVNTLMYDLKTNTIVDFCDALSDIKTRTLRAVQPQNFDKDPLRGIRAARFAATLNFQLAHELYECVTQMNYSELSRAKFFEEITKLFKHPSKNKRQFFDVLNHTSALKQVLPELHQLNETEQDPIHHPEGNVYNHTMLVLTELDKLKATGLPLHLYYATLYHDIAKPETLTVTKHGTLGNPKHDSIGAEKTMTYLKDTSLSQKDLDLIHALIAEHMNMHALAKPDTQDKSIREIMFRVTNIPELVLLYRADSFGRDFNHESDRIKKQTRVKHLYERIVDLSEPNEFGTIKLAITGNDLIQLGYKPGKSFEQYLNYAKNQQIKGATRAELLTYFSKKK